MTRTAMLLIALLACGVTPTSGQILSDSDVEHFAGCYSLEWGEWELGGVSVDPGDLPQIPARLELRMRALGPPPGTATTRGHVISHRAVVRRAVAYGPEGDRLESFASWRASNQRSFTLGQLNESPRVQIAVSLRAEGELRAVAIYLPNALEVAPGYGGPVPKLELRISSIEC